MAIGDGAIILFIHRNRTSPGSLVNGTNQVQLGITNSENSNNRFTGTCVVYVKTR